MKVLLVTIFAVGSVLAEAPYPPSGWRPNGPAFDLPQRVPSQVPQKQEYLPPPVDPRRPTNRNYDDGADVSVQGLPTQEQQPIFQLSPVNGQQYNGPRVNSDIRNLDPSLQQVQYQQQLQKAQEFARQREYDAHQKQPWNGLPTNQSPRQFVPTTQKPEQKTNQPEYKYSSPDSTIEPLDLNQGEELDEEPKENAEKVSVEVSKQNIQEYPPELFLSPLTQLKVQQQLVPLRFGQLQAQIYYQPAAGQGFDGPAHLNALPSVLAQQQSAVQNQYPQAPIIVQEPVNQYQPEQAYPQSAQPVALQPQPISQAQPNYIQLAPANQYAQSKPDQQVLVQPNQLAQPNQFPQSSYVAPATYQPAQFAQPGLAVQASYQPSQFAQPNQLPQPSYVAPASYQPAQFAQPGLTAEGSYQPSQFAQPNQLPEPSYIAPASYQPAQFAQPGLTPEASYQPSQFAQPNQLSQPSYVAPADYQSNQYAQPGFAAQGSYQPSQVAQPNPQTDTENIQPVQPAQPQIVYQTYQPQYYQPNPYQAGHFNQDPNQYQAETSQFQNPDALQSGLNDPQHNGIDDGDNDDEREEDEGTKATAVATAFGTRSNTEDSVAVAQATAVANGRRKSAKLRQRRIRPVFTVDRSGHLVLAQEQ
ncbi:unnamed protein product [Leptidea sinapis]|uniref:DUF4794 domain-containing protein n=1 Tax=Leptidea sinapis TaxID=189913 RepID=A0A5E4QRS9_9NEOP|nr:unnamed protein product [Leptidea sinapis]